jgi:ADP-ribosylglycohydrolase
MLADDSFVPENVARRFCCSNIFGMGNSVYEFLRRHKDQRRPWYESGPSSAGNGALMRIAPMLVPHLSTGTSELWVDTALSAMITHNDQASIATCVSFIRMLWELLQMNKPPPRDWWRSTYVETAIPLEGETKYRPRGGRFTNYEGPMWRFVDERLREAGARRLTARDACDEWWSAAYLLETIPSALYILTLHANDPKKAIVRAVNDTKDNDTIAAIVGAAVGALHGRAALPRSWIEGLTGRTQENDDGRVFELLEAAREKWWTGID